MTARPLATFASEGWYSPGRARTEHYFRPDKTGSGLTSLCGGWGISEGLRPQLRALSERSCQRCHPALTAAALDADTWFGNDPAATITVPRPHVPYGPLGVPETTADAHYLREAARHLEGGFRVGGSNLTATVIRLLRDAATALDGLNR